MIGPTTMTECGGTARFRRRAASQPQRASGTYRMGRLDSKTIHRSWFLSRAEMLGPTKEPSPEVPSALDFFCLGDTRLMHEHGATPSGVLHVD